MKKFPKKTTAKLPADEMIVGGNDRKFENRDKKAWKKLFKGVKPGKKVKR